MRAGLLPSIWSDGGVKSPLVLLGSLFTNDDALEPRTAPGEEGADHEFQRPAGRRDRVRPCDVGVGHHVRQQRRLGGSGALSEELGLPQSTVSTWRVRGIPWRWRPVIADMAKRRKVRLPTGFLDIRESA